MDIDKLAAGHALDSLIAEKIMGQTMLTVDQMQAEADLVWKEQPACRVFMMGFEAKQLSGGGFGFRNIVKPYSTEIAEALKVLDPFTEMAYAVSVHFVHPEEDYPWACTIGEVVCFAEIASLAICRAALKVATGSVRSGSGITAYHGPTLASCKWVMNACLKHGRKHSDLQSMLKWRPEYDDYLACGCLLPADRPAKEWLQKNFGASQ